MLSRHARAAALLCLSPLAALVGCAVDSPDISVPASQYQDTFTAARDVLHSYRFPLDRVDARAGVLTTAPKSAAGLFTPWDTEQTTAGQWWEDTINQQQRRVEITFSPTSEGPDPDITPRQARVDAADLIQSPRDTTAHIVVIVERIGQVGWRANTRSSYLATITEEVQPPVATGVPIQVSDDPPLAGRIARAIKARAQEVCRQRAALAESPASAQ